MEFAQLTLTKITKFVATRYHILRLKSTKFDFGWGSTPDPTGGAYSAPPDPLAGGEGLGPAGLDSRAFGARRSGSSLFTIRTLHITIISSLMLAQLTYISRKYATQRIKSQVLFTLIEFMSIYISKFQTHITG